jgi:GT2 family glycosyltransferase
MQRPSVHVVIVNWNAGSQLIECLNSFAAASNDAVNLAGITVVDNASTDGSLDALLSLKNSLPLSIIRNPENRGFAAASNQGAAQITSDFALFLNPDTRLEAGCLQMPAEFLSEPANASVGIVGIKLFDAAGEVTHGCARRPTPRAMIGHSLGLDRLMPSVFPPHFLSEWAHDRMSRVDQVIGAFFFVRQSVFQALGGFDERFFVYYEDMDFALRASERGWISVYLPTASAFHRGGGTTYAMKERRLFLFSRSRILFCLKHFKPAGAIAVTTVTLLLEPVARMLQALLRRRFADAIAVARGFAMVWADLPNIIRTHIRLANAQSSSAHPV